MREFPSVLQGSDADAVVVADTVRKDRRQVITLTREHSRAALILFDNGFDGCEEGEFDLVIPPQMWPEEWLRQIALLIERSRALNATAKLIRDRSAQLIKKSEVATQASKAERARSVAERARIEKLLDNIAPKPDWQSEER